MAGFGRIALKEKLVEKSIRDKLLNEWVNVGPHDVKLEVDNDISRLFWTCYD